MALLLAASFTAALAATPPSPRPAPTANPPTTSTLAKQRRRTAAPKLSQDSARGFVVAGTILTALGTWSSGLVASRYLDSDSPAKQRMGRLLPIPLAGPVAVAATGRRAAYPATALGIAQGAGLSLLAIGSVGLSRHRRLGHNRVRPAHSTGVLALTQGAMWLTISWSMTLGYSLSRARAGDVFARRLQVPLIGGLWAAPRAPDYTRGYLGLTSSTVQLAAASALVVGAVLVSKPRKRTPLAVLPLPTPDGAKLMAAMRF